MKHVVAAVLAVSLFAFATGALAKDAPMPTKDAQLHQVVGDNPGNVEVVTPYDRAVKLAKLDKDTIAYWNPDGGKYIMAGDYAYVFCKIYKMKSGNSHYEWVAVNSADLNKAIHLSTTLPSGVAFYKLYAQDKSIVMEAIPYDTLHAIASGKPVVDVNE